MSNRVNKHYYRANVLATIRISTCVAVKTQVFVKLRQVLSYDRRCAIVASQLRLTDIPYSAYYKIVISSYLRKYLVIKQIDKCKRLNLLTLNLI